MPFLLESCFELDAEKKTASVRGECSSGFVEEARVATIGPHRFLLPERLQEPAGGNLPQPTPTTIEHQGIECLTHDHYPRVDAGIRPGAKVQTSRVYFRSDKYPDFYYVEMTKEHPTIDDFQAMLPEARSGDGAHHLLPRVGGHRLRQPPDTGVRPRGHRCRGMPPEGYPRVVRGRAVDRRGSDDARRGRHSSRFFGDGHHGLRELTRCLEHHRRRGRRRRLRLDRGGARSWAEARPRRRPGSSSRPATTKQARLADLFRPLAAPSRPPRRRARPESPRFAGRCRLKSVRLWIAMATRALAKPA